MIEYSNEIRCSDGFIYSLDMVRLNLEFGSDVQMFMNWISLYPERVDNLEVSHWTSFKEFAYRDLFQVKTNEWSFAFAIGKNGGAKDKTKGYIEFNPNKCKGEHFRAIWEQMKVYIYSSEVVRYDLAVDIPVPRYLVRLEKDGRNYQYISSHKSDTEYLGQRNSPGYVKVYDKTRESKLDYDLTRIEITCGPNGSINYPKVQVVRMQQEFKFDALTDNDKVLIQLLKQVDNPVFYLKQMSYRKRKKIELYLGQDTVQFSPDAVWSIAKQAYSYQF